MERPLSSAGKAGNQISPPLSSLTAPYLQTRAGRKNDDVKDDNVMSSLVLVSFVTMWKWRQPLFGAGKKSSVAGVQAR
jgi:hypothetical protein